MFARMVKTEANSTLNLADNDHGARSGGYQFYTRVRSGSTRRNVKTEDGNRDGCASLRLFEGRIETLLLSHRTNLSEVCNGAGSSVFSIQTMAVR